MATGDIGKGEGKVNHVYNIWLYLVLPQAVP